MMDAVTALVPRPAWRGVIHRWSVPVAVALMTMVAVRAPTGGMRAALIVYGIGIVCMLAVSGIYHLPYASARLRGALRRVDHSTILLAIAGTYTGVIVVGLDGATRVVLLTVAWVIAGTGVAIRMLWMHAPSGLVAAVYLAAGWMLLLHPTAYLGALDGTELALLGAGGVLYTAGAVVYALRRPDPWPSTFGYHEVFHTLVVLAALSHWASIFHLVTRTG
jgi:hemolysin III